MVIWCKIDLSRQLQYFGTILTVSMVSIVRDCCIYYSTNHTISQSINRRFSPFSPKKSVLTNKAKTLHFFIFIMYVGRYCYWFRVTIWNGDSCADSAMSKTLADASCCLLRGM